MKIPKLRRKKVEAVAPAPVEDTKADSDVAKPKRVSRSRRTDEIEPPHAVSAEAPFTADAVDAPETSFTVIDEDERRRLIAEAAYYRAAQRGFIGGSPEDDWLEAEAEVRARLKRADALT